MSFAPTNPNETPNKDTTERRLGEHGERVLQTYVPGAEFARRGTSGRGEDYWAFVPDPIGDIEDIWVPSRTADRLAVSERALSTLRYRLDLNSLSGVFHRNEVLASSLVEGIGATRRGLVEALYGKADVDPSSSESLVVANLHAHDRALEIADSPKAFDRQALVSIHRTLLENYPAEAHIAGQLRREPVWVGKRRDSTPATATYNAPPHQRVAELIDDLCVFIERGDLNPVLQAAMTHTQFELIHPFADGNGRVGRTLIHVVLRKHISNLAVTPPISMIMAADKNAYIGALSAATTDPSQFIDYFARITTRSAELMLTLQHWIDELRDDWTRRLRPRAGSAAALLIERLPQQPILDVPAATRLTGRSEYACRQALARLENADIVRRTTKGSRNKAYAAHELIDLVEDFPWS